MKRDLVIEGKFVRLEELQPKHFPYIIEWRNNPENNKFLNQPFTLTMELQTKWYEEKYLKDDTQGLFVAIDKEYDVPFATVGWTDYDNEKNSLITGRLLVVSEYRQKAHKQELYLLARDYNFYVMKVEKTYVHIVKENIASLKFNEKWGAILNSGEIVYPAELFVNGMEQVELVRTRESYQKAREQILREYPELQNVEMKISGNL